MCLDLSKVMSVKVWFYYLWYSFAFVFLNILKIPGDLKPPVQELCRVRSNETKQQCEIKNQMPFTNYSVRVQAYNSKGGSDITDKVYVQTLEDGMHFMDALNFMLLVQYFFFLFFFLLLSPGLWIFFIAVYIFFFSLSLFSVLVI